MSAGLAEVAEEGSWVKGQTESLKLSLGDVAQRALGARRQRDARADARAPGAGCARSATARASR